MTDNQAEEVEGKPPNRLRLFKEDSCFSAEVSNIEPIPKYINN